MSGRYSDSRHEAERASQSEREVLEPTADLSNDLGESFGPTSAPDICAWRLIDDRRYLVLGEYARGGLGRILKARDCDLNRPVALKELLSQSRDAEARFAREAEITARLQHPAIVPIYEVGRWGTGKPFYAMKLISGQSLAGAIRDRPTLEERLALLPTVIAVADAIAYAHEQGVIHRDLKPSNVLLGRFGETVVIDWGLAVDARGKQRSTSRETQSAAPRLTVVGTVIGTPEYMAPEQGRGESVDERADVYALGAMLYHLIAGTPPYEGSSSGEVLSQLTAGSPIPLEQRHPSISEELSAIVRKAMARTAGERYPTAKELAEDLRRFQTGQLVGAHQYSTYRLIQRWMNRHRAVVAVAALSFFLFAIAGAVAVRRIIDARDLAEGRRNEMILLQVRAALDRDPTLALAWLKSYPALEADWPKVRNLAAEALFRGVARHVFRRDAGRVSYFGFSPDGALFGSASDNKTVRLSDLTTGKAVLSIPYDGEVGAVDFSPDGKTFLFTEWEGATINVGRVDETSLRVFRGHRGIVRVRLFSPDGRLIASGSADGDVRLWDVQTGEARVLSGHQGAVTWLDFAPNGRQLASGGSDQTVRLWDVRTGANRVLSGHPSELRTLRFSPDGKTLASAGSDGTIKIWDLETSVCRATHHFDSTVWQLAFSPDGRLLASTGGVVIRVLDTQTSIVKNLAGHQGTVYSALFSPDGRFLASAGQDGTIRLWELNSEQHRVIRGHGAPIYELVFSKDGKYLASTGDDRAARVWSVADILGARSILVGHDDQVQHVAFSPDSEWLASASRDRTVRIWNLRTGESRALGHDDLVFRVAFSPDGRTIASAGFDWTVRLWDFATGFGRVLPGHKNLVWDVKFSHSGRFLASAGADGSVKLWEISTGTSRTLLGHEGEVRSLAFSPDDGLIASASGDKTVRLWNVASGESRIVARHQDVAYTIAFSPDGARIASGGFDNLIQIHDLRSATTRALRGHSGKVRSVAFSPDGSLLASASEDATLRVWNLETGQARFFSGHADAIRSVAFSPDGKRLATASWDNTARLWDVSSGYLLGLDLHADHVLHSAFAPDGRFLASAGVEKSIHIWKLDTFSDLPAHPGEFLKWADSVTSAVVGASTAAVTP